MMTPRTILLLGLLACGVVAAQPRAFAAQETADARVRPAAQALFRRVMSPFCPGRLLADCPSPAAADLREQIQQRLAAGDDESAIEHELYRTYGDRLRTEPPPYGAGLIMWVLPPVVFAATGVLIVAWLRRATPAPVTADEPNRPEDPRLVARLEDELADL